MLDFQKLSHFSRMREEKMVDNTSSGRFDNISIDQVYNHQLHLPLQIPLRLLACLDFVGFTFRNVGNLFYPCLLKKELTKRGNQPDGRLIPHTIAKNSKSSTGRNFDHRSNKVNLSFSSLSNIIKLSG